jgi:flagellar biosynthesis protein
MAINKKVVGLAFDIDDKLPRVVLKGAGYFADRIETEFVKSKGSGRVVEDQHLVGKLFRLPTDSDISPDLYELVAILLVHVYAVEEKLKEAR